MQRSGTSIGIVVRDIDRMIEFYGSVMAMGPFIRRSVTCAEGGFDVASAAFGDAEMELIEVTAGRPPHVEFIEAHGEGLNHVCWETADGDGYLAQMSRLREAGMFPYWGYPEAGFSYVNSEAEAGGVSVEVIRSLRGHNHFGLAVEALDTTVEAYAALLGIGPFDRRTYPGRDFYLRGARIDATFDVGFARVGQCRLNFIQPTQGDTPYARHLERVGEGLHHFRIDTAEPDKEAARLGEAGVKVVWRCPEDGSVQFEPIIGGLTVVLGTTEPRGGHAA